MKHPLFLFLLCSGAVGLARADAPADPNVAEARGIVKSFFGSLKGELEAAIKDSGPASAIAVCNTKAPAIAAKTSQETGWDVARTSLKLRNPGNRPDAWEGQVLAKFEERKASGEDVTKMEYTEVVEIDGKPQFRYMKAIPTADLCLVCHGTEIPPDVQAKLQELYPDDQARGFKAGDIRGAFTLSKPL